jgi:hypothetical protein
MIKGGDKGFTKTPKKKPSLAKQIVVKGIKFGAKVATSPITIALAAAPQVYKLGKAKKFKFPKFRQFDKRGRKI